MKSVMFSTKTLIKGWFFFFDAAGESKTARSLAQFCVLVAAIAIYSSFMNWSTLVGVMFFAELAAKGLLYGLLALSFCLSVIKRPARQILPFVCFFALLMVIVLAYEQGYAVKGMVIAVALFLGIGNLILSYRLQQFTSSIMLVLTLLFVAGLMFEVWFPATFSTTLGRSALMYMNPNLAAAGLCLGAFSALAAVPKDYKMVFLILVSTGVLCTLSRSAALGLFLAGVIWLLANRHWLLKFNGSMRRAFVLAVVTLSASTSFIVYSYNNVAVYEWASLTAINGAPPRQAPPPAPKFSSGFIPSVQVNPENIDIYGIAAAENKSSAGARKQLLIRSWDEYWQAPLVGKGLSHAFSLAPHNTYMLFAVAIGLLGWLVLPLWTWVIVSSGRAIELKMTGAFLLLTALFMHDLFTNHALMLAMMFAILVNIKTDRLDGAVSGQ